MSKNQPKQAGKGEATPPAAAEVKPEAPVPAPAPVVKPLAPVAPVVQDKPPEPEKTEAEKLTEAREKIAKRIDAAQKRVDETQADAEAAKRDATAAMAELDKLKAEEIAKYKMSYGDVNNLYLKSQLAAREKMAQDNKLRIKVILDNGLLTPAQVRQLGLGSSPADTAQARKVVAARREAARTGKAFR